MSNANIALVQSLYAAYSRGDVATILNGLTPDVDWHSGGRASDYPGFGPRKGQGAVKEFFGIIAANNEFHDFSPREFYAAEDKVFVLGDYTLTLKKTISTNGGRLHNVYVTPDSNYVIGGSIPSKKLYVFDLATEELAWDLQMDLGVRPMAIEANPDGSTKRIFVQMSNLNGFSVVDFAERKEVTKVPLPEP